MNNDWYFKIDRMEVNPIDPKNPRKPRFYDWEAKPIDGRTEGVTGEKAAGPIDCLQFEVRKDLPAEGLFIHFLDTPPPEGQAFKKTVYASSREVLAAFLKKHGLTEQ